jgi:GTPase KRas protein
MREGKGFLLVYSVTSRSSFDDISAFKDKILRAKDVDNVPIVLVGNKCDLESQRQVAANEGKELARQWGCAFMETSAKERVRLPVQMLLREIDIANGLVAALS